MLTPSTRQESTAARFLETAWFMLDILMLSAYCAKHSTEECMADEVKDETKSEAGKLGGLARAQALSPEERTRIAREAAEKRWRDGKVISAIREAPLTIAGVVLGSAVLESEKRVLTQETFLTALGRAGKAKGGTGSAAMVDRLPPFLAASNLKPFISEELRESIKPVKFRTTTGQIAYGYDATLLPRVCEVYVAADEAGKIHPRQRHLVDQARILQKALAQVGIIALVDEATGYQTIRPKDALQQYLEMIIRKELVAWAKKFPDEFYENIYKLKGWPWPGMSKNRFSVVAHYTNDLVYDRIAPGLREELVKRSPKNEKGVRPNKLHQWLTDEIGNPLLAQHLYSLLMFQRLAIANGYGWNKFLRMVDQVMPKKGQTLELPFADPAEQSDQI